MRCPECVRLGLRSRLYAPTCYTRTAMGGSQQYYDEDGNRHYHEVNRSHGQGHCSEGHVLHWAMSTQCPAEGCEYGSPETITVQG